ncbi:MAG: hypothetical protein H7330_08720 [Hymenobacteraceae bacterium]|nr:hypothetical protein [Hymenobacteraceae bacterium]
MITIGFPRSIWPNPQSATADENPAAGLVRAVEAVYRHWMMRYTATGPLAPAGLEGEPYFKHFHYPSYLTRHAGLVQIRKYAELHADACVELLGLLADMRRRATAVRGELHRVLVQELNYFGA